MMLVGVSAAVNVPLAEVVYMAVDEPSLSLSLVFRSPLGAKFVIIDKDS
jgi:hypothetical protein